MRHPRYTDLRVKSLRGLSGLTCNTISQSALVTLTITITNHTKMEKDFPEAREVEEQNEKSINLHSWMCR